MITNKNLVEKFERELLMKEKVDYKKNFAILNAMYKEAVYLDIFPLKNPLEGIEIKIKIARVVNSVPESS